VAKQRRHPETAAVRGAANLRKKNGPLATPIYQTSTFEVTDLDQQLAATHTDMFYTRYGNPTHTAVQAAIAELENTDTALLFPSGMSAVTTTVLALLKTGDHIVAQRDIYGGVTKFFTQWLAGRGIECTLVDTTDYDQHVRAIKPNTRLLYLESPTNPTLRVVDLQRAVAIAREHGLMSMIDATFSTPINCRPADYGVDLVMHSGTKYYGGHSDLICGILAGRADLIEMVHATRTTLGCNMDPHAAWLLQRGMRTMAVRVERQNASALRVAEFLASHSKVKGVHYPFLPVHPQFDLARRQMKGGGAVLSLEVDGSGQDARDFAEALSLFTLAPSLGGVDSLVTLPVVTSHAMIRAEEREKMGVTEQMVRLSVGIENVDDLIADLERALSVVQGRQSIEVGT
jgi:cystathionine beta-lyase/cystathionine gamma-synthase